MIHKWEGHITIELVMDIGKLSSHINLKDGTVYYDKCKGCVIRKLYQKVRVSARCSRNMNSALSQTPSSCMKLRMVYLGLTLYDPESYCYPKNPS